MSTIIGRMRECVDNYGDRQYIGINYMDNAKEVYKYIFPSKKEEYVDSDLYSPLLYKAWGEFLKKKEIIKSYSIVVKDYRYVIKAEYEYNQKLKEIILGTDGIVSVNKCKDDINKHRYIGGFSIWPSHRGGINFRKNRYKDDIFKTLEDIEKFDENQKAYRGVIPKCDYEWFEYLKGKGGFIDIFLFTNYKTYKNVLDFERDRTKKINEFLINEI